MVAMWLSSTVKSTTFLELRRCRLNRWQSLRGHSWYYEVMLASRTVGSGWAPERQRYVCLWFVDRRERVLAFRRDRLGEKSPLRLDGANFFIWPELQALKVHPNFQAEINCFCLFLRHNNAPAPYSICIYKHYLNSPHAEWQEDARPALCAVLVCYGCRV